MPEYTLIASVATLMVIAVELVWLRTGLFRSRVYWIAMAIVVFFQCLVDGWLTKRPDPIVSYDERFTTGIRFPFAIPIEDWLFGFAMVTLALLLWLRSDTNSRRN